MRLTYGGTVRRMTAISEIDGRTHIFDAAFLAYPDFSIVQSAAPHPAKQ